MPVDPDSLGPASRSDLLGDPVGVLRSRFGFSDFRAGQRELVDAVLRGEDALGILPTGGGKSLCYQVPAVILGGLTLVISPLISLMVDQVRRAEAAGISAAALHSGIPSDARVALEAQARAGDLRVLLVAPERLESSGFVKFLSELPVRLITMDEAHCIALWGHDFRPAYRRLGGLRARVKAPVLALTATATPRVQAEISSVLRLDSPTRVVLSFDRPNLGWGVLKIPLNTDRISLHHRIVRDRRGARLIYASTRRRVEEIRDGLRRRGLWAEAYHAGLGRDERARVQQHFLTASAPVVVATNAFGMGIDRPDVRLVVHDQLSGSLEDYYQEAGRAGRDGRPALCLALRGPQDQQVPLSFLDQTHPPARGLSDWARSHLTAEGRISATRRRVGLAQIERVDRYATTPACRRGSILRHFGEAASDARCEACDSCVGWVSLFRFLDSG